MIDGPHEPTDDVAVGTSPVGAEDGHGHDPHAAKSDAGDALTVVSEGGDDARHLRSMAVRVGVGRGVADKRGARHQLAGQVRMRPVDAGVEDRDDGRPGRCPGAED